MMHYNVLMEIKMYYTVITQIFFNSVCLFQAILGKLVKRPSELDNELVKDLMSCPREDDEFSTVCGKTMCTLDFYEGNS